MLPQLLDPRPYFAELPAPRRETRNQLHNLDERWMIVRCAVLSGVEDGVGMADCAEEKEAWLRGFGELPNGIASHDPWSEVLGRIEPVAFKTAVTAWATAAWPGVADAPGCVEGQAVGGSRKGANRAVPRVRAVAGRARGVLGQPAVAAKSHELTARPDRLGWLDLHGAVVSLEAMGGQKAMAQTLLDAGADSVLALTDHPPTVGDEVPLGLEPEVAGGRLTVTETGETDHGRSESRRAALSSQIDGLAAKPAWTGRQAVGRVESTRRLGDHTGTEGRYFLCAFLAQDRFAVTVRRHGGLDNPPHGGWDVHCGQAACRAQRAHAAENLARMRRLALNRRRHHGPPRDRLRRRKRRAALNDDYRLHLLFGQPSPTTP